MNQFFQLILITSSLFFASAGRLNGPINVEDSSQAMSEVGSPHRPADRHLGDSSACTVITYKISIEFVVPGGANSLQCPAGIQEEMMEKIAAELKIANNGLLKDFNVVVTSSNEICVERNQQDRRLAETRFIYRQVVLCVSPTASLSTVRVILFSPRL